MCEQKPLVRYLAPCKGVQVQSRILDLTPWIPDSLYTISVSVSGTWIPTVNGIPDLYLSDLNFSYILNNTSWFQLATPYYNER